MLDTRQIRLIVTVAEHGNLVRAGRVLGMSASALTRAITTIEERLEVSLFDRSRRGFEPTAICRAIISKGSEVLARADELAAMVGHLRGGEGESLVLSAGPSALDAIVSPAAAMFLERQPGTQVRITGGSAIDAVRDLVDRRAALAVAEISDLDSPEELVIKALRRHPLLVLVRAGHPLLGLERAVEAADVFRYPVIVPPFMSARFAPHVSAGLEAAGQGQGRCAFPAIIAESVGASLAIATQSDAVTTGTAQGALPHIRSGALTILPWRPTWLETNFGIMHLRSLRPGPAIQAMIECLTRADEVSFDLARNMAPGGMAEILDVYAVIGRRTAPALVDQPTSSGPGETLVGHRDRACS
jgi:DNA-binding transcriptional LysR family regulator